MPATVVSSSGEEIVASLAAERPMPEAVIAANNLVAVEEIMSISARLIVNQAALKLKRDAIQPLLDGFAGAAVREATDAAA